MSTGRRTEFREAMERSRRFLGRSERQNDTPSDDRSSTLLEHVSIRQRASAEARFAAKHELPTDAPGPLERLSILSGDDTDYAETVHARLEAMRGRILESSPLDLEATPSELPLDTPRWVVGEDSNQEIDQTVPIWREVLNHQRNLKPLEPLGEAELGSPQVIASRPASTSAAHAGFWPPLLTSRQGYNFSEWQHGPSNRMATQAANEIIDYPGTRLNPLLIHGGSGTGKSHLLWSVGDVLYTGLPDRDVRLVTAETFPAESLPSGWDDTLMQASALLIDDADRIIRRPGGVEMLAKMVGWAIDIGAQVLLTSSRRLAADSLPIGRLRQALASGVHVELGTPSDDTLLLYLRRKSLSRGISLTDPQLRVIVGRSRGEWSRTKADFEAVCLALEAGAELLGPEDVTALLSGEEPPMRDSEIETVLDADSIGARIVTEVLDSVLSEPADSRAEIVSQQIDLEDDYIAPEIHLPPSHLAAERLAGDQLRVHLQDIDRLAQEASSIPRIPAGTNLDALTDSAMDRLESIIHEHRFELRELTDEISGISERIGSASETELVSFADRMLAIENHLGKLRELTNGELPPPVDDFDPSELIKPVQHKVLVPLVEEEILEPQRAILRPIKRRVLLPAVE
ncbi:MAG: DnaA/Hda family protein [Candidatus Thalassarchaeaceae archaeon]|nr:DnaA/Hda family protein [Candidatus Thalassarchaeaceae archaeon]